MKKGDKVKMMKGLRVGKVYGKLSLLSRMRFKGCVELPDPNVRGNYYINNWYYSPEMLELATPDPS